MRRALASREGGFTLTELMVAVAILGILAAVTVPSLSRNFRRSAVRQVAAETARVFTEFRAEATSTGRAMYVAVSTSQDLGSLVQYVIAQPSGACTDYNFDWQDALFYRWRLFANEVVAPREPVPGGTLVLCLKPNGRLYRVYPSEEPVTGTVDLDVYDRRGGDAFVVRVGMTGHARVN